MSARSFRIAALLFVSGFCALVYQSVWLRELRLVFGASTPATAAVLAVFMGGLGFGSLLLGKRAETVQRPLAFYGLLELLISAAAGISPWLLRVVREGYIALGGSVALGWAGGTFVRLLLTAIVLLPPTLAMGGTLPAAARAATTADDSDRRSTALLYGINTLGAVLGAALSTFLLLESLGARSTLLVAVGINVLCGLAARVLDARFAAADAKAAPPAPAPITVVDEGEEEAEAEAEEEADSDKSLEEKVAALQAKVEAMPDRFEAVTERDPGLAPVPANWKRTAPAKKKKNAELSSTLASVEEEAESAPEVRIVNLPSKAPSKVPPSLVDAPLSRTLVSQPPEVGADPRAAQVAPFVLAASLGVGFAFLLMELVWYRVLSPLLGGSSYTFGLILAVALAGIGLGGLLYTLRSGRHPAALSTFAVTCVLEALFISIPYALGDRVAILALSLRGLGAYGLSGFVAGWAIVAAVVALPAAIVAGYQFPLLIALLGKDRNGLARHVGAAYAYNTAGAILGSLLGGFVLMPRLSALGAWRLSAWLLLILAVAALWLHDQLQRDLSRLAWPAVFGAATLWALHATTGPTAVWRHSPIGAGRSEDLIDGGTTNTLKKAVNERRRAISWMVDGRESSIGLYTLNDVSFLVNGKSDGAAVSDGGTQVMGGLIGALLKPEPVKRALAVGLGSGSTAGWLGQLPDVEKVHVVELEPAMLHVARVCAPVNRSVLDNPKVEVILGDAREVLLATPDRYDLVFSEPSNPYRAGVASLFTREFYEAVQGKLNPGGVFVQWLQAYEIDAQSLRVVYATLSSVFPSVETWRTKYSDLVLISRAEDTPVDLALLRRRITEPPFAEALLSAWRVDSVEGVLSHYVARPGFARAIAEAEGEKGINTDDQNALEFSIARALGRPHDFSVDDMMRASHDRGEVLPELIHGSLEAIDKDAIYDAIQEGHVIEGGSPYHVPHLPSTADRAKRYLALDAWDDNEHDRARNAWLAQKKEPRSPFEIMMMADLHAIAADEEAAAPLIEKLAGRQPIEANVVRAKLLWAKQDKAGAWVPLREALVGYKTDPWPTNQLMSSGLAYLPDIARSEPQLQGDILDILSTEFALYALHYYRVDLRLEIALIAQSGPDCLAAVAEVGPNITWERTFLERRVSCFELANDPRLPEAKEDLAAFDRDAGMDFASGIRPPGGDSAGKE